MKPKVYVVDNNATMREFLYNYFEREYDIKTFESGIETLYSIYNKEKPQLIIMEHELPGVSGLKVLKNLKASEFYKDIPVLFVSRSQSSSVRVECLKAGAEDFLIKPFNPSELRVKISKIINTTTLLTHEKPRPAVNIN